MTIHYNTVGCRNVTVVVNEGETGGVIRRPKVITYTAPQRTQLKVRVKVNYVLATPIT